MVLYSWIWQLICYKSNISHFYSENVLDERKSDFYPYIFHRIVASRLHVYVCFVFARNVSKVFVVFWHTKTICGYIGFYALKLFQRHYLTVSNRLKKYRQIKTNSSINELALWKNAIKSLWNETSSNILWNVLYCRECSYGRHYHKENFSLD